jgi:hypothetical protein
MKHLIVHDESGLVHGRLMYAFNPCQPCAVVYLLAATNLEDQKCREVHYVDEVAAEAQLRRWADARGLRVTEAPMEPPRVMSGAGGSIPIVS